MSILNETVVRYVHLILNKLELLIRWPTSRFVWSQFKCECRAQTFCIAMATISISNITKSIQFVTSACVSQWKISPKLIDPLQIELYNCVSTLYTGRWKTEKETALHTVLFITASKYSVALCWLSKNSWRNLPSKRILNLNRKFHQFVATNCWLKLA